MFLVDLREVRGKGCEITPIDAMINHNTTQVFFDDMRIPADTLVGEEGKGFYYILDGMNAERILIAGRVSRRCALLHPPASEYASEREVFGRPIGQNQGIQFPIARAHAETEAAALVNQKAAALFDAGLDCGAEANMAKMLASEAAWHAGEAACRPSAASPSRASTTSSASGARLA